MKNKSFYGKTAQVALNKAIEELGEEAIVISTKKIKKEDKFIYEVIAGLPSSNTNVFEGKMNRERLNNNIVTEEKEEVSKTPITPTLTKQDNMRLKNLENKLNILTNSIESLQNQLFETKQNNLIIPPEFRELSLFLKNINLSDELYEQIMKISIANFPIELKNNTTKMKEILSKILQKHIQIREEKLLDVNQKKIIIVVGPTGVGKTTTVAKLGSRFILEGNYNTSLITMDQYRIGAEEQLFKYAELLNCQFDSISSPSEFLPALKKMKNSDYIIIDTLGTSQFDKNKINQLSKFLEEHTRIPFEVLLTIPANIKYKDMLDIYDSFSDLKPNGLIATKMDETKYYGDLFSFIYKTKIPLNYLTIGQSVPEDLLKATRHTITNLLFDSSELIQYRKQNKKKYQQ